MKWSYAIVGSFVLFVAYILFLVFRSMNQNIDLVAEDYYAQEIAYQEVIDQKKNYEALGRDLEISQNDSSLLVELPHDDTTGVEGEVYFYHPSEKAKDQKVPFTGLVKLMFSKSKLLKGNYKVKIRWAKAETTYYYEEDYFVQK